MTPEQKAAYINAQSVCALAEIAGMIAFNQERSSRGLSQGYDEGSFFDVPGKYYIHHNQICELFRE